MSEDISRFLFQPEKRYSSVRMQQGRVILDSDWNEGERINAEEARRILVETVCANGTPNEGFLVKDVTRAESTYDFALGDGSFYLGGLRFEINSKAERFLSQADWLQIDADLGNLPPLPPVTVPGDFLRLDLVYLRGWEQTVTAVEDSELREPALGGTDSSTRIRLMRQIVVLPDVDLEPEEENLCDLAFDKLKAHLTAALPGDVTGIAHLFDEANCELRSKATLTITFGDKGITDDPCKPKVTAGFLGAENQTIRVQLTATNRFIWGYDNASPLYRVQVLEGQPVKIRFLTLPRDQAAQPLKGQAVEILPWSALLPNQEKMAELQGHLATVATSFNPEDNTITLSKPVPQAWIDWLNAPAHAQYLSDRDPDNKKKYFYLRLWTGGSGEADEPDHAFTRGAPVELAGTGLNVTFSDNGLPGDFWIIGARPNTADLVAPWELMEKAPPAGTRFFFAPLALIGWGDRGGIVVPAVEDCRHKFRPLCEVDGGEPGIHIVDVKLMSGEALHNDTNVPVNAFAQGIQVLCDGVVDQNTIRGKPTCIVTLDLPFPFNNSDRELWGNAVIGFQPLILAANATADDKIIFWAPAAETQKWLVETLFTMMTRFQRGSRVLAHLTLKGNFIWSRDNPPLYLDGEAFGFLQPDQTNTDIDLRKGSGNGLRGGDFELWFWLVAQPPAAKVMSIDPPDESRFFMSEGGGGDRPPSRVVVTFDKSLRADTVNERTIQVMMFPDNAQPNALVAGRVAYNDTTKSAEFQPNQPLLAGVNGFRYEVTVRGNGPNPILDIDGLALDGNGDGIPGGDHISQFSLFFVIG